MLNLLLADDARRRELLCSLEVGARERRGGFYLGEAPARDGQLVGQIAGPHESDELAFLDAIAAVDENRVDVAEDLGADIGLLEGAEIDWRAHFDRHVARFDFFHHDQRRGSRLRCGAGVGLAAARGDEAKERRPRYCTHTDSAVIGEMAYDHFVASATIANVK